MNSFLFGLVGGRRGKCFVDFTVFFEIGHLFVELLLFSVAYGWKFEVAQTRAGAGYLLLRRLPLSAMTRVYFLGYFLPRLFF